MNKTLTKFVLDIILTALFIALIYPRETGFTFHEMAGLASGALIFFHLVLNWSWVKNISKNLFKPKVKSKTKFFYLLNTISLVTFMAIVVTGIQISTVLFPNAGTVSHTSVLLHKWLSYSCLVLLGLHLALHWGFFVHTVPRMFRSPGRPTPGRIALNLGALVLTLGLIFVQTGFNQTNTGVQTAQGAIYSNDVSNDVDPVSRSGSVDDSLLTNNTVANTRGSGKKHSSTVAATIPTTSSNISSSTANSSTNISAPTAASAGSTADLVTLNQYLGNLFCTGCSKHCSLLSPQCSIGVSQAAAAQQQYTAIYGSASLN